MLTFFGNLHNLGMRSEVSNMIELFDTRRPGCLLDVFLGEGQQRHLGVSNSEFIAAFLPQSTNSHKLKMSQN
jgi:hypothetical protein